MIVGDNRDAGQVLASLLEATGHQVLVREDAESALVGVGLASERRWSFP